MKKINSYFLITRKKIPAYLKYYWSKITSEIKTKVEGIPPLILLKSLGKNLINYLIYGNSVQDGTPTTDVPIEIESVGDLITDTNDVNYGKYKIPVKVKDTNNIVQSTINIYLDEPLRKIGDYADYVDFKNSKVVRNIKEMDMSIITDWLKNNNNQFYKIGFVNIYRIRNGILMSNVFIYKTETYFGDNTFGISKSGNLWLQLPTTSTQNKDTISAYLESIGAMLIGVLETPKEESISLPNIPTIKGTTVIEIDTEIQTSKIEVDYLRRW